MRYSRTMLINLRMMILGLIIHQLALYDLQDDGQGISSETSMALKDKRDLFHGEKAETPSRIVELVSLVSPKLLPPGQEQETSILVTSYIPIRGVSTRRTKPAVVERAPVSYLGQTIDKDHHHLHHHHSHQQQQHHHHHHEKTSSKNERQVDNRFGGGLVKTAVTMIMNNKAQVDSGGFDRAEYGQADLQQQSFNMITRKPSEIHYQTLVAPEQTATTPSQSFESEKADSSEKKGTAQELGSNIFEWLADKQKQRHDIVQSVLNEIEKNYDNLRNRMKENMGMRSESFEEIIRKATVATTPAPGSTGMGNKLSSSSVEDRSLADKDIDGEKSILKESQQLAATMNAAPKLVTSVIVIPTQTTISTQTAQPPPPSSSEPVVPIKSGDNKAISDDKTGKIWSELLFGHERGMISKKFFSKIGAQSNLTSLRKRSEEQQKQQSEAGGGLFARFRPMSFMHFG